MIQRTLESSVATVWRCQSLLFSCAKQTAYFSNKASFDNEHKSYDNAVNDCSVDIKLFLFVLAEMLQYKVNTYML